MARGLAGSYGQPTQNDPKRFVSRDAMAQSIASRLREQGRSAVEVQDMPAGDWSALDPSGVTSPKDAAARLRIYESYAPELV